MIEKDKSKTAIYIVSMDFYRDNLEYLIEGIEYSIARLLEDWKIAPDGLLNIELIEECLYGSAFIAMQNYIDLTIADFYIATYEVELSKSLEVLSLQNYAEKARRNDIICKNNITYVELINALANSYKHRNELEVYLHKKINTDYSKNESKKLDNTNANVYRKKTQNILNIFGLLDPDNNDDIWPASNGILILDKDYNLKKIINHLFESWRPQVYNMFIESKDN